MSGAPRTGRRLMKLASTRDRKPNEHPSIRELYTLHIVSVLYRSPRMDNKRQIRFRWREGGQTGRRTRTNVIEIRSATVSSANYFCGITEFSRSAETRSIEREREGPIERARQGRFRLLSRDRASIHTYH